MSHSHSRISIHAIWSTKDRMPLILPTDDQLIYKFPEEDFHHMDYPVKTNPNKTDHINVLFLLNPQISLAEAIKQTMGNPAHPIYQQNLIRKKFSWQGDGASPLISRVMVKKDSLYNDGKMERYYKKSFQSKYSEIIKNHGFEMEI